MFLNVKERDNSFFLFLFYYLDLGFWTDHDFYIYKAAKYTKKGNTVIEPSLESISPERKTI